MASNRHVFELDVLSGSSRLRSLENFDTAGLDGSQASFDGHEPAAQAAWAGISAASDADTIVASLLAPQSGAGQTVAVSVAAATDTAALADLGGSANLSGAFASYAFAPALQAATDAQSPARGTAGLIQGGSALESPMAFSEPSGSVETPQAPLPSTINVGSMTSAQGIRILGAHSGVVGAGDDQRYGDLVGRGVASAGDVNGDGIDDMLISARFLDGGATHKGAVYVVYGKSGGTLADFDLATLDAGATANGFRVLGPSAQGRLGSDAAGIGDINGDGFGDILVGGYQIGANGANSGASYVIFGHATGSNVNIDLGAAFTASQGFRIIGAAASDLSGYSVAALGDVNGDGRNDFVITALLADPSGRNSAGAAYVIYGKASGYADINLSSMNAGATADGFRIAGAAGSTNGDRLGIDVSSAGDFNGDGRADILIAANQPSGNGMAYVIFGHASGNPFTNIDLASLTTATGIVISGTTANPYSGYRAVASGDVNGDGLGDLVIGNYSQNSNNGAVYVVFGRSGAQANINLTTLNPATTGFKISGETDENYGGAGFDVSAADVNGDGKDDVIVGVRYGNRAYVVYGTAVGGAANVSLGSLGAQGVKINGATRDANNPNSSLGRSLEGGGDFNGDGLADILIGDNYLSASGRHQAGGVYVVFGGSATAAPTVNANLGLTLNEGATGTITTARLDFNDADTADSAITYTITAAATNGNLFRNGVLLGVNGTFTQADINAGLITYVHNGGETTSASFGFSVSDGSATVSGQTFTFTVTPVNDEPTLSATALNPTFAENAGAADLFSTVTASTVETGQTFASLTLTVTNVTDGAAEVLTIDGSTVALTNGASVTTATNALNVTVSTSGSTATVTFSGATLSAAALQALVDGLAYRNTSDNPTDANRVVTITRLVDSGSNTAPNDNIATLAIASTVNVNPANDAPVVDLDPVAGGNNNTASYTEQAAVVTLASGISVTDVDSATLTGATVRITAGFVPLAGDGADYLGINGSGAGTLNGTNYSYSASTGILTLTGSASVSTYQSVLAQVTFQSTTNNPGTSRTVTWTVNDGTVDSAAGTTTINVTAVNDAPVNAVPGAQNGTEDTNLVFSTANGNAISVSDLDAGGSNLTVTLAVTNGVLTLSGTAGLSFSGGSDGTNDATIIITGTASAINAALNGLVYRGNLNFNGGATLTVTTSDNGNTGTGGALTDMDSVSITLAPDNAITGDGGNNTFTGTPGNDFFDLRQGGTDNVSGGDGNDGFYFGGAYTGGDTVDGGAGTLDQIGLQGNYAAGVTLGGLAGVEMVVLLPGNDTRFGDTAGNFYDYNITSPDSAVAAGQRLIVQGNTLRVGEDLTFNGSAETNGSFLIYGGFGVDTLTGGAGNDGFFFGQGRFGASDVINGGGGTMDQLGLQGNYTGGNAITFGASQLTGIEYLVLLSASDNRFGSSGGTVDYNLTMNNGNVAAGQTLIISANTLLVGEDLSFNGSAETNGRFEVYSGASNDVITGGSGADLIFGGGAGDTLTGGAGNDVFAYSALTDSNSTERDGIQDFTLGDRIDLSRIDANSNVGGQQGFTFVGTSAFSGTAGELRYENISLGGPIYLIQGDVNGDGVSDMEIVYVLTDGHQLTTADFIGVNAPIPQEPLKLALDAEPDLSNSPGAAPILGDPDDLDMSQLDNGGAARGHIDMTFARDTGGPALFKLVDADGLAMAVLHTPDDNAMISGTHDLVL